MKINNLFLFCFCILIFSCKKEEIEIQTPSKIVAIGQLNGENWKGYQNSIFLSDGFLNFGIKERKETAGCPHHEISFRYLPIIEGSYLLKSINNPQQGNDTINSMLYYTCGDGVIAFYNVEEDSNTYITITSVTEDSLKGNFSTTYILGDSFPDVPQKFEFTDIEFNIGL